MALIYILMYKVPLLPSILNKAKQICLSSTLLLGGCYSGVKSIFEVYRQVYPGGELALTSEFEKKLY